MELLGTGRSADVYALDGDRVLRRYRDGGHDAREEAAVMAYVAAHGYPVPEVYPELTEDRPADLVMRRLSGPTMLQAVAGGSYDAEEGGRVGARLLRRLHAIPARLSPDPRDRVLHLDLHPDNVMLTPEGPVVIDWCNTAEGPPELDNALSAVILAQVAVSDADPLAAVARPALRGLLAGLGDAMDYGAPLDEAARRRSENVTLSAGEVGLIGAAVELIRDLGGVTPSRRR
ncbi:phosphotransferase [Actinomadura sp. ATCC 31491]|uniref:Phosphotransferase n=1 Tax=Actinomadura luzonensis TaxID=2805427 RepID=A0ABT0FL87_9ACTN|nr:phosphotransferase [Actinomadura luzonensis]MCK2213086.1 phosphotransferase [Actinomadura luzonensis]